MNNQNISSINNFNKWKRQRCGRECLSFFPFHTTVDCWTAYCIWHRKVTKATILALDDLAGVYKVPKTETATLPPLRLHTLPSFTLDPIEQPNTKDVRQSAIHVLYAFFVLACIYSLYFAYIKDVSIAPPPGTCFSLGIQDPLSAEAFFHVTFLLKLSTLTVEWQRGPTLWPL